MSVLPQEILNPNNLSLDEHVQIIRMRQQGIKEAFFDFVASVSIAFEQLGQDVFERDLARELGMAASTLNRWRSIGSSKVIAQNIDSVPPVFSSLYEITLLEKLHVEENGESQGLNEVQKLINRGMIKPSTETKDIRFLVDKIKKNRLEAKRNLKEKLLLDHSGSVGYEGKNKYPKLRAAVDDGVKVRTIVIQPPHKLLSKWADPAFLRSDIQAEFPISELRGKSELDSIVCVLKVPNSRIDVGIKILVAGGFRYRRVFFHMENSADDDVVIWGQRGAGGADGTIVETRLIDIAKQIGSGPFMMLFDHCDEEGWISIEDPI